MNNAFWKRLAAKKMTLVEFDLGDTEGVRYIVSNYYMTLFDTAKDGCVIPLRLINKKILGFKQMDHYDEPTINIMVED